jgi:hypothetical protein
MTYEANNCYTVGCADVRMCRYANAFDNQMNILDVQICKHEDVQITLMV